MDNYLKENRNPIEDREIQEHFSLGRFVVYLSKKLITSFGLGVIVNF